MKTCVPVIGNSYANHMLTQQVIKLKLETFISLGLREVWKFRFTESQIVGFWKRFIPNKASACPPTTTSGKASISECQSLCSNASKTLRPRTVASIASMLSWRWRKPPSRICWFDHCNVYIQASNRGMDGVSALFVYGQSLLDRGLLAVVQPLLTRCGLRRIHIKAATDHGYITSLFLCIFKKGGRLPIKYFICFII